MVLGFLLADTNPKAAGDFFSPLAASCLTPLQGSHIHILAFLVSHKQTYTDEHMMDYKYTGQDWVCVQPSIHRGTHRARSSSAAELSVSTFLLGVKKKKKKVSHLFLGSCSFGQTCQRLQSANTRACLPVGAHQARIRCVSPGARRKLGARRNTNCDQLERHLFKVYGF